MASELASAASETAPTGVESDSLIRTHFVIIKETIDPALVAAHLFSSCVISHEVFDHISSLGRSSASDALLQTLLDCRHPGTNQKFKEAVAAICNRYVELVNVLDEGAVTPGPSVGDGSPGGKTVMICEDGKAKCRSVCSQTPIDAEVQTEEPGTTIESCLQRIAEDKRRIRELAAGFHCTKTVETLISDGIVSLNRVDHVRQQPLIHQVVNDGNLNGVKMLAENGAEVDLLDGKGRTALHLAAIHDDEQVMTVLLEHGANCNALDGRGRSSLFYLAKGGSGAGMSKLLNVGANINLGDGNGLTSLHHAIADNDVSCAKQLIKWGASLDVETERFETPLRMALRLKNAAMVMLICESYGCVWVGEWLVEHRFNMRATGFEGETIMLEAVWKSNRTAVDMLVKNGADIHSRNNMKLTALHIASKKGFYEIVDILLRCAVRVDDRDVMGMAALHWAVIGGWKQVVEALIRHGADVNAPNAKGQSPLHFAALWNKSEVAKLLSDAGASLSLVDTLGYSALHIAVREKCADVAEVLLDTPEALRLPHGDTGDSILHFAVKNSSLEIVKLVLTKHPTLSDATNCCGRLPLHIAAMEDRSGDIVSALAQVQVSLIDTRDHDMQTPLHLAAHHGNIAACRALLDRNASPNIRDAQGQTALHKTVRGWERNRDCGNRELLEILLQAEVDVSIADEDGNTAQNLAEISGHLRAICILSECKGRDENMNCIHAISAEKSTSGRDARGPTGSEVTGAKWASAEQLLM